MVANGDCYNMKNNSVHFVGIGGIGVSALAAWFLKEGWGVSGSDLEASEITVSLGRNGADIKIGPHHKKNVPNGATLLVHTAAAHSNPEINEGRRRKIRVKSYAEALGDLTRKHLTVAVAGSHGKSTTTALVALILTAAGFDPTVIIGTKLREFADPNDWRDVWLSPGRSVGANFRKGSSPILVIEADEWGGSFWNYSPAIAVVTNVDKEHLDFYKTERRVRLAFQKFIMRLQPGGHLVVNADDEAASRIARSLIKKHPSRFRKKIHFYSLNSPEAARVRAFTALPGRHNAGNAMAACATARILNIPPEIVERVLADFEGAWRRFEPIGKISGSQVIADYAHHPQEIKSTLEAARGRFGSKKIIVVFQPHQYERTRDLFKDFETAFDGADLVCLLDIYEVAGRERNRRDPKVNAFHLARAIANRGVDARYVAYPSQLREFLENEAGPNSVILMMGAGSIWKLGQEVLQS